MIVRFITLVCLFCSILFMSGCIAASSKPTNASFTSTLSITPTVILQTPTPTILPTATFKPIFGVCQNAATPIAKQNTIKRLVYIASEEKKDVWLWDMGQEPVRLTNFGDVTDLSISRDGAIILFARQLATKKVEIWKINADASGAKQLLSAIDLSKMAGIPSSEIFPFFRSIKWIGNSHAFAFNRWWNNASENVPSPESLKIWLVNAETATAKMIGKGDFNYSPNGQFVLIYNDNGMALYDADGNPQSNGNIPEYKGTTEDGHHVLIPPSWSQNSESFLLVLPQTAIYQPSAIFKVLRIWVKDQHIEEVGIFHGFAEWVDFSPDQKFMFYHANANMRPNELHLVDLDEKKDIIFSKQDDLSVDTWSPNSRDFIFDIVYSIYLGNICKNIKNVNELPGMNSYQFPFWLDNTTLLIVELGDDRLRNRSLYFKDLTGNYKSNETVLALRSYDFAIVSP